LARQRNYHAEYQRRKERAAKLTPYQATHRRGGTARVFLEGFDQVVTVQVAYRDASRLGKYNNLARKLVEGKISEREFDQKTRRMAPLNVNGGSMRIGGKRQAIPAGRYRFANADLALYQAEMERALPDRERNMPWFDFEGS
jgi:hypothetical protein